MISVDTSVWIAALRDAASSQARTLQELLDLDQVLMPVPVRIEILSGASNRERVRLRRLLSALPQLVPTEATWERIDGWLDRAGAAHQRFGIGDLLIAAMAAEYGAALWSLDRDFVRMARLGFVKLYRTG